MRYSINGDFYRITRITGPTHNLLGLAFSGDGPQGVTLERLAGSSEQSIDEGALEEAVLSGVEAANKALGTGYRLKRIQYVPTDTPDAEIYAYLARMIVERLASGANFDGVSPQTARGWRSVSDQDAKVEHPV
ncbi:MAG: hypothetical protein ACLQIB_12540 [Isosphaeraceae bacterium]